MTPEQAIAQLQQLGQQSPEIMKKAEFTVANKIATTAIGLAPEDTGKLIGSIGINQDDGTLIDVKAPYAPYVEFGTGPFAEDYIKGLPEEWQDEAIKFFINGEGHTQPHPFFYPAVNQNIGSLNDELEKEFEKITL